MKVAALGLMLLALAGCQSARQREERKLVTMQKSGASISELCRQSKKIVDAYDDANDVSGAANARANSNKLCHWGL